MNKFSNDTVSVRQLVMLLFLAMMSPFASVRAANMAALAGKAAFLAPFVFLGGVCAVGLALMGLFKTRIQSEGLFEVARRSVGDAPARVFAGAYGALMLLMAAQAMRYYGERFLSSAGRNPTILVYAVLMATLVALTLTRRFCDLARAGQVFFVILAAVLLAVYSISVLSLQPVYVLPVLPRDTVGTVSAGAEMLRGISVAVGAAFLAKELRKEKKNTRRIFLWTLIFALNAAAMMFVMTATFSPEITAIIKNPAMEQARGLRLFRKVIRIDPAVVALWTLSDFCFVALACRVAARTFSKAFGVKEKKLALPVPAATLILSMTAVKTSLTGETILPGQGWAELILCFFIPVILYFVGKIREKNKLKKLKNNA
ncbi:MAG: GerAB/ArcD/ProY family transporter [Oscillospiraceae bacterium]|nr:GerAB/ArcD/ProY family transporter [Oscillospiraceae bacterium]